MTELSHMNHIPGQMSHHVDEKQFLPLLGHKYFMQDIAAISDPWFCIFHKISDQLTNWLHGIWLHALMLCVSHIIEMYLTHNLVLQQHLNRIFKIISMAVPTLTIFHSCCAKCDANCVPKNKNNEFLFIKNYQLSY